MQYVHCCTRVSVDMMLRLGMGWGPPIDAYHCGLSSVMITVLPVDPEYVFVRKEHENIGLFFVIG